MSIKEIGNTNRRHSFIDRSAGIAILLVIYGHIIFPETLNINWYAKSREFVYKFHMPLFMCISGYLVFLSVYKKSLNTKAKYLAFQKTKLKKFLPAYIIFSFIAIFKDLLINHISFGILKEFLFAFFFQPVYGSAAFVWYLYVLTGFYLITPLLLGLQKNAMYLLLAFGFVMTNIQSSPIFCADMFFRLFFFFLAGGMIYLNQNQFIQFLGAYGGRLVLLSIVITTIDFLTDLKIPFQLTSILLIPSILYLTLFNWSRKVSNCIEIIGSHSFAIYLLNTTILSISYVLFKNWLKLPIDYIFIFSSLFLSTLFSILFKIIFNKIVPKTIYTL